MSGETVAAAGAGRMGQGLAVVFAYAGHPVQLVDLKKRDNAADYLAAARSEIEKTPAMLASCGMIAEADIDRIAGRVAYVDADGTEAALSAAELIFEARPKPTRRSSPPWASCRR